MAGPDGTGTSGGEDKFGGVHVRFCENVCDVTGAQGQRYTAPITAMSPGPVLLPK